MQFIICFLSGYYNLIFHNIPKVYYEENGFKNTINMCHNEIEYQTEARRSSKYNGKPQLSYTNNAKKKKSESIKFSSS